MPRNQVHPEVSGAGGDPGKKASRGSAHDSTSGWNSDPTVGWIDDQAKAGGGGDLAAQPRLLKPLPKGTGRARKKKSREEKRNSSTAEPEVSASTAKVSPDEHHHQREQQQRQQQQKQAHRKEEHGADSWDAQQGETLRQGALQAHHEDSAGVPDVSRWRSTSEQWGGMASPLTAVGLALQGSAHAGGVKRHSLLTPPSSNASPMMDTISETGTNARGPPPGVRFKKDLGAAAAGREAELGGSRRSSPSGSLNGLLTPIAMLRKGGRAMMQRLMPFSDRGGREPALAKTRDDRVLITGLQLCDSQAVAAKLDIGEAGDGHGGDAATASGKKGPWWASALDPEKEFEKEVGRTMYGTSHGSEAESDTAFLISALTPWRRWWDVLMLLLLMWTLVSVPLSVAFLEDDPLFTFSPIFIINKFVDSVFMADMLLNMITVPLTKGSLRFEHSYVVSEYLRGWFLVDLAGSIPYSTISYIFTLEDDYATNFMKLGRLGKILRFLRIIRIMRLSKLLSNLFEISRLSSVFFKGTQMALTVVLSSHVLACGFYAVGSLEEGGNSWIDMWSHGNCPGGSLRNCENSYKWMVSFYWTIATLNTVGYGDITPMSVPEIVYSIFVLMAAFWLFASIVANIAETVEMESYTKRVTSRFFNEVKMWSHTRELPISLNAAVENQMNFIVSSSSSLIAIERTVIRELPFHLRNDLCMHLYKDVLGACPFFKGRDAAFISQVAIKMFPLHITAESHVYTPQDSCDDMYFVAKGQVALIVGENNGEADGGITVIEQGGWFGLLSLLGSTGTWNENAMTMQNTEMWALSQDDLYEIAEEYEDQSIIRELRYLASWHERGLPGCDGIDTMDLFNTPHDVKLNQYLSSFDNGTFGNFSALASASSHEHSTHWHGPKRGMHNHHNHHNHGADNEGIMETMGQMVKYGRVSNIVGGIATVIKGDSQEGPSAGIQTVQHLRSLVEGGGDQQDEEHHESRQGGAHQNSKDKVTDIKRQFSRATSQKALKNDKGAAMGRSASKKNIKSIVQKKIINPMRVMKAFKTAGDDSGKTANKFAIPSPVGQDRSGLQAAAGLSSGKFTGSIKGFVKTVEASSSAGLQDTTFDGGAHNKAIEESLSLTKQASASSTPRDYTASPLSAVKKGPLGNRSPMDLLKDGNMSPMQVLMGKRMNQSFRGSAKHLGEELRSMETVRESPEFRSQALSRVARSVPSSLNHINEARGTCVSSVSVPCDQCGRDISLRMIEQTEP